MPELPELETILNKIKVHLIDNIIKRIIVRKNNLRYVVPLEIINIYNKKILNIKRKGKYLLIRLNHGWIIIHLGMTGNLFILHKYISPTTHDHIDIILKNNIILRYNDPRRFGSWTWIKKIKDSNLLLKLGIEPLSNKLSHNYLFKKFKNKKTYIKSWIMNNKNITGIGNIYANEILFAAKISPQRAVNSLTKKEIIYLIKKIKNILQSAINYGGTTIKNFLQPDQQTKGFFVKQLSVYGKKDQICTYCKHKIQFIKINQRSTYYCKYCQI
uniref:Formamidopyrimidine-DNA glycosylase n=1 Tax=Candidatus Aschnera chinzeii TaxID=1485666 RepID=A0AAT9G474_9ENTR|nr:MAG: bifunctional DNA-formamidopyrimidine glycosylase/DNA-(apurinic or apyrimidinic site) lyase [Candidatus Aschnera chinzeii]